MITTENNIKKQLLDIGVSPAVEFLNDSMLIYLFFDKKTGFGYVGTAKAEPITMNTASLFCSSPVESAAICIEKDAGVFIRYRTRNSENEFIAKIVVCSDVVTIYDEGVVK